MGILCDGYQLRFLGFLVFDIFTVENLSFVDLRYIKSHFDSKIVVIILVERAVFIV